MAVINLVPGREFSAIGDADYFEINFDLRCFNCSESTQVIIFELFPITTVISISKCKSCSFNEIYLWIWVIWNEYLFNLVYSHVVPGTWMYGTTLMRSYIMVYFVLGWISKALAFLCYVFLTNYGNAV